MSLEKSALCTCGGSLRKGTTSSIKQVLDWELFSYNYTFKQYENAYSVHYFTPGLLFPSCAPSNWGEGWLWGRVQRTAQKINLRTSEWLSSWLLNYYLLHRLPESVWQTDSMLEEQVWEGQRLARMERPLPKGWFSDLIFGSHDLYEIHKFIKFITHHQRNHHRGHMMNLDTSPSLKWQTFL